MSAYTPYPFELSVVFEVSLGTSMLLAKELELKVNSVDAMQNAHSVEVYAHEDQVHVRIYDNDPGSEDSMEVCEIVRNFIDTNTTQAAEIYITSDGDHHSEWAGPNVAAAKVKKHMDLVLEAIKESDASDQDLLIQGAISRLQLETI
jgi:hypothetical protein